MKKIFRLLLCFCLIATLVPMSAMAEAVTEPITYTQKAQGSLQNVAAGKPVFVSSAVYSSDTTVAQHTGNYINDEYLATWWESKPNEDGTYDEGECAVIDLTRPYAIYEIELQFANQETNSTATLSNDAGFKAAYTANINASIEEAKNWEVYGSNQFGEGYELLASFGDDAMNVDLQRRAELYGKKYRYIKIVKTSAAVAKLYEVRVFGVEPAMIDVTPKSVDMLYTNGENLGYALGELTNGGLSNFFHFRAPEGENLRFTLDLGAKYKVRRVELRFRNGTVSAGGDDRSRKNFHVWAGNADNKEVNICNADNGHKIWGIGWNSGVDSESSVSYQGTITNGGGVLFLDSDSNEATQFVSMEWTNNAYGRDFSLAEIKVWAEDEASEEINLKNVSKSITSVNSTTYTMDLGAYYNIKQIEVTPASGTLENFRIHGNVGHSNQDKGRIVAFLASQTEAITETTKYDVESFNMTRFVTLKSKTAIGSAPTIRVYAEDGVVYENKALNKTASNAELVNGSVSSQFDLEGGTSAVIAWVDLGLKKEIDGFAVGSTYLGRKNPTYASGYIIYGANNSDFSDKVILFKDDIRSMRNEYSGEIHPVDSTAKYRYIGIASPNQLETTASNPAYVYTIASDPTTGEYTHGNAVFYGSTKLWDQADHWPVYPRKYRYGRQYSELMVFTEVSQTQEIGYTDKESGLTDKSPATIENFVNSPVVEFDRLYPLYSVALESALAVDTDISASKNGSEYVQLGTIKAGSTLLEIDNSEDFYKYVKFTTSSSAEVAQVNIYTYVKYSLGKITAESCVFNNSKDGTGTPIKDLSSDILGATVVARNTDSLPQSALLIVALYDDNNMLIDLEVSETLEIPANGGTQTFSAGVDKSGNPAMLKAFLWESLGGLNPLMGSESLD